MSKQPKAIPKVAIITRTKDRSLLLERAIKSVEAQGYDDYVHVIFNDGGDPKKLDTLLKKYDNPRRVVVHNKETIWFTKALNQAIRSVDSTYITILDDDDSWPAERLAKTIPYLEKTGEKAVAVKMDTIIEEIHGDKIKQLSQNLHPESGEGEISLFKQCYKNYLSNGIITYRRKVYDELGGYDESLEVGEDWDFGIRLLMKYDVAFLRDEPPLFFYHQRPGQKGVDGNSVHAGVSQQEKTINLLRNRYLRQDLQAGRFGVGYIMNKLEYDRTMTVRLEAHVNRWAEVIDDHADKTADKIIKSTVSHKIMRRFGRSH